MALNERKQRSEKLKALLSKNEKWSGGEHIKNTWNVSIAMEFIFSGSHTKASVE